MTLALQRTISHFVGMVTYKNRMDRIRQTQGEAAAKTYSVWTDTRKAARKTGVPHEFQTFEVFFKAFGEKPKAHQFTRLSLTAGFTAQNCEWVPITDVKHWNQKAYNKRKAAGMWLNRRQRILSEQGHEYAKAYSIWIGMRRRVARPVGRNKCYADVRICKRWLKSFENFVADMGPCPPHLTIDRIDPAGDYKPSNCRWATWQEQALNKRKKLK